MAAIKSKAPSFRVWMVALLMLLVGFGLFTQEPAEAQVLAPEATVEPSNTPTATFTPTPSPTPTSTPTRTPVPTSVTAVELMTNGGFEIPGVNTKAEGWSEKSLKRDKRQCNKIDRPNGKPDKIFSFNGECAFLFRGVDGYRSQLVQTVTVTADSGDTLQFSAWVSGKNVVGGVKVQARVKYVDGSKLKLKLPAAELNNGSYGYTFLFDFGTLTAPVDNIKIKLKMGGSSGKVFFDDVSLSYDDLP